MTRLLLIGASGLDWGEFDRLTRAGELPALANLRLKGAAGWLGGAPAAIGPAAFGAIASGQQPEVHGLWRAREAWAGGIRPSSRASWRTPPVWAYLEAAGIRTGSVAWPGTRPGVEGPGAHIDEDFVEPSSHDPEDWALPLRCVPNDLREALRARRVHPGHITAAMMRPLAPDLDRLDATRDADLPAIRVALASAATIQAAAVFLLESRRTDALFVRQSWLGRIRLSFGQRRDSRFSEVLPAAWRLLDHFVGRLVEAAGPEAQLLLTSPGWLGAPGVVMATGAGVTPDPTFRGANILDIAPTVLARFGLTTQSLPGRPIAIAAPASECRPAPEPPAMPPRRPDDRTMHVVRAAGYRPAPRAPKTWEAQGLAELAWMVLERDPSVAGEIADAALRLDPTSLLGLKARARAKVSLGEEAGLEDLARALLDAAPDQPWGAMAMGALHVIRGKAAQAAPWLAKAEEAKDPSALITVGGLWLAARRPGNAARVFRSVLVLDPNNAFAEMGLAMAAMERRDFATAEAALLRALKEDPGRPATHLQLARVFAKTGRERQARQSAATAMTLGASRAQAVSAWRVRNGV